MKKENNINRYSYIRSIACIGIVFLHMIYGAVTIYGNEATEISRKISWIVVNNLYWAVPCFVMVTGALLLDPSREVTYKKLFCKYIFRVALALLICTVLYRLYDIIMNAEGFSVTGILKGFTDFFTGGSWSHLWYLYMLIGLYLLLPFFKKITEHVSVKELGYFLLLIVIFLSLVPILKLWNIGIGFGIPVASIYPFYLFFGYIVTRPEVKVRKAVAAVCLILSTAALILLTLIRWDSPETMNSLEIFFNYSSIFVILQATSIFYLFAKKNEKTEAALETAMIEEVKETVKNEVATETTETEQEEEPKKDNKFKQLVLSFDSCTFGIYLIHMFLARYVLRYMGIDPYENILLFVGLVISVIIVSYLIVWLLRKIPKVNKIL